MKSLDFRKHTGLSTTDDVSGCLEWKILSIEESGLDIEESLCDYIGYGISEIENSLEQLKRLKLEIKKREDDLKSQKTMVLIDGAKFLQAQNIDKLNGNILSSVTVTKAKEETITTKEVKEFVINISDSEVEELLIGLGKAELVTRTIEKTSNAMPAKLRINKRKIALSEVVE